MVRRQNQLTSNYLDISMYILLGSEALSCFRYQKQTIQATHCLVGHIHLDKKKLNKTNVSVEEILQKCRKTIYKRGKKKGQLNQLLKRIELISRYKPFVSLTLK